MDIKYNDYSARQIKEFSESIFNKFKESGKDNIIVVNIGTDKNIGDSFAPMVGTKTEVTLETIKVYGSLKNPIHALNLNEKLDEIYNENQNSFIVGIDASIGDKENIGIITLRDIPISPGKGIGKSLSKVGDVSILGIISDSSDNLFFNKNIRLDLINDMSDVTAYILTNLDYCLAKDNLAGSIEDTNELLSLLDCLDELSSIKQKGLFSEGVKTGINNKEKTEIEMESANKMKKILTPLELKAKLDEVIIGQDEAKTKICTEVFKHYLRMNNKDINIEKNNILLTGLTGTGKTFIWQNIAKILDIPIYIQDSTSLTSAGYVGMDVENCLKGLCENADYDIDKAEYGIVVFDEFDKLSRKSENPSITRDVSGESVQQAILKMLEGDVVKIPEGARLHPREDGTMIDTKNILFVATGSYEGIEEVVKERLGIKNKKNGIGFGATFSKDEEKSLDELRASITRDDLKKYGMLPEVLGRFSVMSNLLPLHKDDLINILKLKQNIFGEYTKIFELLEKNLTVKNEVYEYVAEESLRENIGARGLKAIVENIMTSIMFKAPSEKKINYVISLKDCLVDEVAICK